MLYTGNREQTTDLVTLLDLFKRCFHDGDQSLKTKIDQKLKNMTNMAEAPRCEQFSKITPACMEWFGASVAAFLSPEQSRKMKDFYGCMYVEQEYPLRRGPTGHGPTMGGADRMPLITASRSKSRQSSRWTKRRFAIGEMKEKESRKELN